MPDFKKLIARLKRHYGEPKLPPAQGPFELVMWENACYLLSDERRAAVFEGLRAQVGLDAGAILNADRDTLLALARMGGMRPQVRVFRWREIARITMSQFDGDLDRILREPLEKAKKALKQFPNIGDPGAEKILMFCGVYPGLPLEWNGLRVLTRVGYGRAQKNYGAATARSRKPCAWNSRATPRISPAPTCCFGSTARSCAGTTVPSAASVQRRTFARFR
jgi:endonuclease-3